MDKDKVEKPAAVIVPPVVLCLGAQLGAAASVGGVDSVDLRRGLRVSAFVDGKASAPVTFDGNVSAFLQAFAELVAPTSVRIRTVDVERDLPYDGGTVRAKVPQHTAYLVDG